MGEEGGTTLASHAARCKLCHELAILAIYPKRSLELVLLCRVSHQPGEWLQPVRPGMLQLLNSAYYLSAVLRNAAC